MKAILPYIVLFVGSLVMAGAALGGLYAFRPDLLGLAPAAAAAPTTTAAAADTTGTASRAASLPRYGPTLDELRGRDPLSLARDSVAVLLDSLRTIHRLFADARTRTDTAAVPQPALAAVSADSSAVTRPQDAADRKAIAKLLESMAAENVVRLLEGMSDQEVKELLLSLKTKQAAKILAALDPDRAAKLIRRNP